MSTTARQRPWDQYEKSIGEFLRECGSITMPMNQRNYLWKSSNIEEFLNDMEVFLKGDMRMCFGNVIQFVDKHEKEIWDGQQRIITSVLFLLASHNFLQHVWKDIDSDYDKNQTRVQKLKNLCKECFLFDNNRVMSDDVSETPRVTCVSPDDKSTMCSIVGDYEPIINFQDHTFSMDNHGKIKCKLCEVIVSKENKLDFRRHLLVSCKKYEKEKKVEMEKFWKVGKASRNDMLNAYEQISTYLFEHCTEFEDIQSRISMILDDYVFIIKTCNNKDYVSKLYDFENNRGLKMETIDVIKNYVLSGIPEGKKTEVFELWVDLKSKTHNVYSDYGEKLFRTAIQIFNNNISMDIKEADWIGEFTKIVDFQDEKITFQNTSRFLNLVQKLIGFMDDLNTNRFCRLVLHQRKAITFSWEAYMYLILPKCYVENKIDDDFIEKLVSWQMFMSLYKFNQTFNGVRYTRAFCKSTTQYVKGEISTEEFNNNIYTHLLNGKKLTLNNLNKKGLKDIMLNKQIKGGGIARCKTILSYLETLRATSIVTWDLNRVDHEHIVPKESIKRLKDDKLINSWGNMTLLESRNTKGVQIGNRGIKISMHKKKESYAASTFWSTREIESKYPGFFETENEDTRYDDIIKRRTEDIIDECVEKITFEL
jgi:hypothetical protein|tara:strand:+ start:189 stop:2138 length:1950 start_codon:yes stop_codon:yes gene_type:complete